MKHDLKKTIEDHIRDIGGSHRNAILESHVVKEFFEVKEEVVVEGEVIGVRVEASTRAGTLPINPCSM
jgi:hypothetical protein